MIRSADGAAAKLSSSNKAELCFPNQRHAEHDIFKIRKDVAPSLSLDHCCSCLNTRMFLSMRASTPLLSAVWRANCVECHNSLLFFSDSSMR